MSCDDLGFSSTSDHGRRSSAQPFPDGQPPQSGSLFFKEQKAEIEERLLALLETEMLVAPSLREAMRYALSGEGKRFRPLLFLCIASSASQRAAALDIGCAIEMVHTASLILDDLPCMDDADIRRSRATTHKAFGQATAILASIALLSKAFNIISRADGIPANVRAELTASLSRAVGPAGLAAGQELDVNGSAGKIGLAQLEQRNWLKTGVLFAATVEMAAMLEAKPEAQCTALREFAYHVGLAFQALDDCRDATAATKDLGKDVGKDAGKASVVSLLGISNASRSWNDHLIRANAALVRSGVKVEPIGHLLEQVFPRGAGDAQIAWGA